MRITVLLTVLLSVACRVIADRAPAGAVIDTPRVSAAYVTPLAPAIAPAAARAIDPALDSLCSAASKLAHDALEIPIIRDTAMTFAAPRTTNGRWRGCRMTATSSGIAKDPAHPDMPDGPLQAAFIAAGWVQDLTYEADGPDGTELAMRKGSVLCHLGIQYLQVAIPDNPGAEPSAQVRTANPYTLEIRCASHPALPRD